MVEQPGDAESAPLTYRLAGMLELYGHGWTCDEIGELQGVTGRTVREYHLRKARRLLGVGTVEEAVEEAVRLGLIDLTGQRPIPTPPPGQRPYDPSM